MLIWRTHNGQTVKTFFEWRNKNKTMEEIDIDACLKDEKPSTKGVA